MILFLQMGEAESQSLGELLKFVVEVGRGHRSPNLQSAHTYM